MLNKFQNQFRNKNIGNSIECMNPKPNTVCVEKMKCKREEYIDGRSCDPLNGKWITPRFLNKNKFRQQIDNDFKDEQYIQYEPKQCELKDMKKMKSLYPVIEEDHYQCNNVTGRLNRDDDIKMIINPEFKQLENNYNDDEYIMAINLPNDVYRLYQLVRHKQFEESYYQDPEYFNFRKGKYQLKKEYTLAIAQEWNNIKTDKNVLIQYINKYNDLHTIRQQISDENDIEIFKKQKVIKTGRLTTGKVTGWTLFLKEKSVEDEQYRGLPSMDRPKVLSSVWNSLSQEERDAYSIRAQQINSQIYYDQSHDELKRGRYRGKYDDFEDDDFENKKTSKSSSVRTESFDLSQKTSPKSKNIAKSTPQTEYDDSINYSKPKYYSPQSKTKFKSSPQLNGIDLSTTYKKPSSTSSKSEKIYSSSSKSSQKSVNSVMSSTSSPKSSLSSSQKSVNTVMSPKSSHSSRSSAKSSQSSSQKSVNAVMSPTSSQSSRSSDKSSLSSSSNIACEQYVEKIFGEECDVSEIVIDYYNFSKKRCQQLIKYIKTCNNMFAFHHFVKIMTLGNEHLSSVMCDLLLEYFISGKFDSKFVESVVKKPNQIDTDNIQNFMNSIYQRVEDGDMKKYYQSIEEYNNLLIDNADYSMADFLEAELKND